MCTLAWGQDDGILWACFNRDEQRSRARAEPPAIHRENGRAVIYARDPVGGGTWCAVSEAGFAVGLLNHYPGGRRTPTPGEKSRGELVVKLIGAEEAPAALALLEQEALAAYAPFYLVLLSRDAVRIRTWSGDRLEEPRSRIPFITTSSHQPEAVVAWRRRWWGDQSQDVRPGLNEAARLMRRTWPDNPALGLTMDRKDARTLSQIELEIVSGTIRFLYRERNPSGTGYLEPVRLSLPV